MERVPDVTPDVPPVTWRLLLAALGRLPARALSRSFGAVADVPLPRRLRRRVLSTFAGAVGIDLEEVELPLAEYRTLNEFFVRRLRRGVRSWPTDPAAVASPVDGIVGRSGPIEAGRAIQAKGHDYSLAELLGSDAEAKVYDSGRFLTIYLSPRHYHRIHTPVAGEIRLARYVPGSLYPVNAAAVMHVPGLFVRNERLLCYVESGAVGRVAVVAVGAYNVGRISAAFDPAWAGDGRAPWVTNRTGMPPLTRSYDPAREVATGDELMAFHLGSTVVLLFPRGVRLREELRPGSEVRVGEVIARAGASSSRSDRLHLVE